MSLSLNPAPSVSSSLRALREANAVRSNSIGNLASGELQNLSSTDGGSFAMASRIEVNRRIEHGLVGNLQSLVSFSQSQDALLGEMASILGRIGELATYASNAFLSNTERNVYELEHKELVKHFEGLNEASINGRDYFFSSFSEKKSDFIQALKDVWFRASEELIEEKYGLTGDGYEFPVYVTETVAAGKETYMAWVTRSASGNAIYDMTFQLPQFPDPASADNTTDRTVAHELVHATQVRNAFSNLSGLGESDTWFREGVAELIIGRDDRIAGARSGGQTDQDIVDSLEDKSYAGYYSAARYLHHMIKTKGQDISYNGKTFAHADGVKSLLLWQQAKFKAGESIADSGYSKAITEIFAGYAPINSSASFLADFKSNAAQFLTTHVLTPGNYAPKDLDTGAIGGLDADGGSPINWNNSVPDTVHAPTSDPEQPLENWKIVWEEDEGLSIATDPEGTSWKMASVDPTQYGSPATYNLNSQDAASLVIARTRELLEDIGSKRSAVGANLARFHSSIERLQEHRHAANGNLAQIRGAKLSEESTSLAKATLKSNLGLSLLIQANLTSTNLMQLLE